MKYLNPKNIILFCVLNFLIAHNSYSQDEYSKWVFGIGLNAVDYYPTNTPEIGGGWFSELTNAMDHWNFPGLKLNATRHIIDKVTFDLGLSYNKTTILGRFKIEALNYYAVDGNVHYNFLETDRKFVPYVLIGAGYTFGDFNGGGTFNSGIGANLWLSSRVGLNAEGSLKYNSPDFSLVPHFYYSFSVIFKLEGSPSYGRYRRYRWRSRM